jgi:chemotaxis signal transduction protein
MLEKLHEQTIELQGGHGFEAEPLPEQMRFIRFRIGHQELLIAVDAVVQVSGAGTISAFPGVSRYLQGLFVTRGEEVTPVVDLAELLGLTWQKAMASQCCLVVTLGGERFALLVDSVSELVSYDASLLEKSHSDLFGSGVSVVSGVIKDAESVFPVINVNAIFQAVFIGESRYEHTTH